MSFGWFMVSMELALLVHKRIIVADRRTRRARSERANRSRQMTPEWVSSLERRRAKNCYRGLKNQVRGDDLKTNHRRSRYDKRPPRDPLWFSRSKIISLHAIISSKNEAEIMNVDTFLSRIWIFRHTNIWWQSFLILNYVAGVKSTVKILSIFVDFRKINEYFNHFFTCII